MINRIKDWFDKTKVQNGDELENEPGVRVYNLLVAIEARLLEAKDACLQLENDPEAVESLIREENKHILALLNFVKRYPKGSKFLSKGVFNYILKAYNAKGIDEKVKCVKQARENLERIQINDGKKAA